MIHPEDFSRIRAFVFDVDGVLSAVSSPLDEKGEPVRTANVRDGFAIRMALEGGLEVAIITGGVQERVKMRYGRLGVRFFYDGSLEKTAAFRDFTERTGIPPGSVLYMGDDFPDLPVMKMSGIPACPADAAEEIKAVASWCSRRNGGEGCVREAVELVLRAQGKWPPPLF